MILFSPSHPVFRDHQLSVGGGIHVLADDFFKLIGRKFDRLINNVDLFFRLEITTSESG